MVTKEQMSGNWNAIVRSVRDKFSQISNEELEEFKAM